jgi:DNA-binding NarL/FixJ family response regulator
MNEPIRVVIADDHAQFRQGLVSTIAAEPDMLVIGQGATGDDAVVLSRDLSPDIVLLDLDMPGGGLLAAAIIAAIRPATKIVILTGSAEEEHMQTAQRIGACGYILKGVSARELVRTLHAVTNGTNFWPAILC